MKKIVVNDTNIFIDLLDVGLLDEFFLLSWEIHTTDFVMYELLKERQKTAVEKYMKDEKFHVAAFAANDILEISNLHKRHEQNTNVSFTDCSVWYYAKKNRFELLTGDKKQRSNSLSGGVEVHDILYVFDALVSENIIQASLAAKRLKYLQKNNARLPKDEIAQRLKLWEQQ